MMGQEGESATTRTLRRVSEIAQKPQLALAEATRLLLAPHLEGSASYEPNRRADLRRSRVRSGAAPSPLARETVTIW